MGFIRKEVTDFRCGDVSTQLSHYYAGLYLYTFILNNLELFNPPFFAISRLVWLEIHTIIWACKIIKTQITTLIIIIDVSVFDQRQSVSLSIASTVKCWDFEAIATFPKKQCEWLRFKSSQRSQKKNFLGWLLYLRCSYSFFLVNLLSFFHKHCWCAFSNRVQSLP